MKATTSIKEQMATARKNKDWKQLLKLTEQLYKQSFKESQQRSKKRSASRKAKVQQLSAKTVPLHNKAKGLRAKVSYALDTHVPCPSCGSKNTNLTQGETQAMRTGDKIFAGLIFLPLAFLVGNKRVSNGECFDCETKWAIN